MSTEIGGGGAIVGVGTEIRRGGIVGVGTEISRGL